MAVSRLSSSTLATDERGSLSGVRGGFGQQTYNPYQLPRQRTHSFVYGAQVSSSLFCGSTAPPSSVTSPVPRVDSPGASVRHLEAWCWYLTCTTTRDPLVMSSGCRPLRSIDVPVAATSEEIAVTVLVQVRTNFLLLHQPTTFAE